MTAIAIPTAWGAHGSSNAGNLGPFIDTNGYIWVVTARQTTDIAAFRSTDGGGTWTRFDNANTAAGNFCDVVYDGSDTFYVVAQRSGQTDVGLYKFTLSTQTWTTEVYNSGTRPTPAVSNVGSFCQPHRLLRRSDGTFVFVYQGPLHSSTFRSVYFQTISAIGDWGTATELDTAGASIHYDMKAAVLGASDRVHVLYLPSTTTLGLHRSIDSANTLDTEAKVDPSQGWNAFGYESLYYHPSVGLIASPVRSTPQSVNPCWRAASQANPVWTADSTSVGSNLYDPANNGPQFIYVPARSLLYMVWASLSPNNWVYWSCPIPGTTWSASTVIDTSGLTINSRTIAQFPAILPGRGDVGLIGTGPAAQAFSITFRTDVFTAISGTDANGITETAAVYPQQFISGTDANGATTEAASVTVAVAHTYRLGSGADGNYGALFEADQTAASRADGWTVAKIAAANSAEFDTGTKQASGAFSTQSGTPKPGSFLTGTTANAFKTPQPLTGTFSAAAWTLAFAVRAVTASSQAGRMRLRVFRSVNASGAGATELTGATQVGSTTAALSTTVDQVSTVTWSPGAITLNNEYLFFVIAWEITTASGSNSGDVVLRTGQAAAGTFITTPGLRLPKIETLADTFDTVVDKTVKWPDSNAAAVWDASTRAKLPCATTYSTLATHQAAPSYDLSSSAIYAKMTSPATGTGTRELWLDVLTDTGNTNKLSMVVSGGILIARRTLAGAQSGQNTATYDPVAHAWWRIREAGGTTFFDVSPDGLAWTNFYSVANGQPVTACWVSFSSGYFGTETADNGYVDNVNTPPPTAVSATDTNGATTESVTSIKLSDTDVGGLLVPGTAQLVALIGAPDASNLAADAATLVAKPATTIDVNGATTETQAITVPVAATDANGATTEATSFAPIAVADTDVNSTTTDAPTVKAVVAATDANATTTETGSAVAAVTPVSSSDANGTTTEAASIQIAASDANGATTESAGIAVYSSDAGGSAALPAITTSGLAIRFDASQLALADGASVSPWPNIANAAVPGTISGSPAPVVRANALNGLPVVRFNLGQGAVVIASGSGVDKDFTIAYVAHMVSATVNNGRVLQALIPNNVLFGFWKGGLPSGVQDTAYVDPNFLVPDNRPAVTTAWKLYSADGASASYLPRMFSNGVLVSTAPSTPTGGFAGTLALNHPYTGSPDEGSDCEVAEVIVYNRQLSDVERQTVESYLRQKWLGVAVVSETATVAQPSTFTGTDTNGATTEAATVVVKATATDANGATTDAQTLVAKPADTDNNGATTEATTIVAKPSSTDANAATTEAVALAAQLSSADANGATTDATTQTAAIPATDTNGAVTEAASQRQTTADANGVVTEATTSVAQLAASDANSATTETQAQQQTATDTNGAVTEATALVFAVTVTDANGPTTEIQSTGVPIPAADTNGTTTEATTLVAQLAATDISAAVTESAAQQQTTSDANGAATESAALALPAADTNAATTETQTLRLSAITDQNAATTEAVALVAKLSATDQDVGAAEATTIAASAAVSGGPQAGGSVVESYLRAGADFVSGGPGASGSKTESWSITVAVSGGPAAAGSKAEASVRTDARGGGPIAGGSLTQTRTNTDTVSGGPAAAGTRTESRSATDARAGGPIAAGSVVESQSRIRNDIVTGGPIAGGTRVESRSATDVRSGGPAAAGSVIEVYQRAGADVVSGGPIVGGSRVESWAHSDFVTGGPGASGSLTESHGHANIDTVAGGPGVTGHVTDTRSYNDASAGGLGVSGSVVESYSHVLPPLTGALSVTGSVVEQRVYTDAPTGSILVAGSTTAPIVTYNDSPRGGPVVRGSVVETWGRPAVFPKVEQPTSVLPLTLSLRTVALTDGSLRTVTILNGQRSTLESPLRTTKVELSMTSVILPKGAQGPLYIDKPEGELMVTGST